MELRTIASLFEDQVKDLYSAEVQLLKVLTKMAARAQSPSLREAFEAHVEETREHVERLKRIGEDLGIRLGGKKCAAMEGIIEEGTELLEADGDGAVIDEALIITAQRAEHYEITAYGSARTLARHLGLERAAEELQRTLDEESATDEKLTRISLDEILPMTGPGTGEGIRGEEEGFEMELAEETTSARGRGRRGGRAASTQRTAGRTASGRGGTRTKKSKPAAGAARGRGKTAAKGRTGTSRRR